MLPNEKSDEELMALYQEGSEEAFRVLYDRHSRKIFGYLGARVRNRQKVNDLFQEVFVKIHASKRLYNRSFPLLPWLFSVTHSVLIDGLRKDGRQKEVMDFDFDALPASEAEKTDRMAEVGPLVGLLPANQQVALKMRYVDEKTFEEIAERLRTSPLNARQVVSRGVKQLRKLVGKGERP